MKTPLVSFQRSFFMFIELLLKLIPIPEQATLPTILHLRNMIEKDIERLRITRNNFHTLVESVSLRQLNNIPEGFNNNIIWNFAHNVVTQQLLCYGLAGATMRLPEDLIHAYRKGTAPVAEVDDAFVTRILKASNASIDWMLNDYKDGKLSNTYRTYTTSYNITLSCVEEAIAFNNIHEGLHLGYAMALRKRV